MSNETSNHDAPLELAFDVTKTSEHVKFLGLSQRDGESDDELPALFDWTCPACNTGNRDSVAVKPQKAFSAEWTCSRCSRVTLVRFRARAVAEWIAQHTLAVTGKPMDAAPDDPLAAASLAACDKRLQRRRRILMAWVSASVLMAIVLFAVLDIRRVRNSSASPGASADATTYGRKTESASLTPSARVVGYWISEQRDHVVHFSSVDPVQRTGTYVTVYRGDQQGKAVQFKVLYEETAGEQLVIRKEGVSPQDPAAKPQEVSQSQAAEITLNVAKDGQSMTRLEIVGGKPVMTAYSNVTDTAGP